MSSEKFEKYFLILDLLIVYIKHSVNYKTEQVNNQLLESCLTENKWVKVLDPYHKRYEYLVVILEPSA